MNEAKRITTQEQIRRDLEKHLRRGWILTAEIAAEKYGCNSLRQRICELRKRGMKIASVPCPNSENPQARAYRIER